MECPGWNWLRMVMPDEWELGGRVETVPDGGARGAGTWGWKRLRMVGPEERELGGEKSRGTDWKLGGGEEDSDGSKATSHMRWKTRKVGSQNFTPAGEFALVGEINKPSYLIHWSMFEKN